MRSLIQRDEQYFDAFAKVRQAESKGPYMPRKVFAVAPSYIIDECSFIIIINLSASTMISHIERFD